LFNYQHHIVRDLAWAIASPPLLSLEKASCSWYRDEWYENLYITSRDWLQRLDEAPGELQERLECQKDRRLGRYFETLWAFWLENNPRFELIEQNLALRDEGKTLGELDFLVLDKVSGQNLHWEVAVKFYLGVGDTRQHSNWHGPGRKDRLDLKVEHLRNRQSVIYQRPVVQRLMQAMGYRVDACGVILKGRLFYPYSCNESLAPVDANPGHLRSYWLTVSALQKKNSEGNYDAKRYSPLVGYGWMASARQDHKIPWMSLDELLEAIKNGDFRLPLQVSCKLQDGGNERFFVVEDRWSGDLSELSEL
jgi:hypothetical protein